MEVKDLLNKWKLTHLWPVFEDSANYMCKSDFDIYDVPVSVEEALSIPDHDKWRRAMVDEMQSFEENDAWDLVDISTCETIVECK